LAPSVRGSALQRRLGCLLLAERANLVINSPAPGWNKPGRNERIASTSLADSYAVHDPTGNVFGRVFLPRLFRLYAVSILARLE
jgi:hypothetical protein